MILISAARELLGSGSLLGYNVLGPSFEPWVFMVMPPGGFLTLGIALLGLAFIIEWRRRRAGRVAA
jgi:electron transport complex protein RnfE